MSDALERSQARRWAEMEATAAAATEQINALTERLEEEIYLRSVAERASSQVETDPHWGRVYWATEDEPDAKALLDLSNGRVLLRRDLGWIDAADEKNHPMIYLWAIDGGPFIAWDYEYHFSAVVRELADNREQHKRIAEIIRAETGKYGPLMEKPLDAVVRMAAHIQKLRLNHYAELDSLRTRINELARAAA